MNFNYVFFGKNNGKCYFIKFAIIFKTNLFRHLKKAHELYVNFEKKESLKTLNKINKKSEHRMIFQANQ